MSDTAVFALDPAQRRWCGELRALAAERLRPLAERSEPGRVNRPLVEALGELGLLARLLPADGSVHALTLCLLRESLARECTEAETALALQGLGAHPLVLAGTAAQRARWLPAVRAGRAVAAFALSEPEAGSDAAALSLRAEAVRVAGGADGGESGDAAARAGDGPRSGRGAPDEAGTAGWAAGGAAATPTAAEAAATPTVGEAAAPAGTRAVRPAAARGRGGWRLTGEKCWISNAPDADFYTVFARTGEGARSRGVTAFLVPADRPGLTGERVEMLSPHPIGTLTFDGVPVGADDVLGAPGEGFRLAMRTLNLLRPSVGAFAVGMAQAALDAALDHAAHRTAFGGPLKDLQSVAHRLAEMATRTEAARLLVYAAAAGYDAGAPDVALRSAMAKLLATETAQYVVDAAVQIHGARALRRGHPLEHLYREVRAPRIYEGATEVQRTLIAKELYR
ncbi:acyl-CoA dehydrogenase family protein [Streptomyces sp. LX-29]|uniref:acyl-CoA dehydrogenase family protein n=1 Tax=Streptomyces sp. LX-29 TaxID=2900152 RepID=UPI00240D57A3|nr:acyl-CoA dehydrogenase family protein [Streptomyces sp. LX-29]WFB06953.1 acyl-CoA dehydrogenase family protein [Streptomyces sp. LX-29]